MKRIIGIILIVFLGTIFQAGNVFADHSDDWDSDDWDSDGRHGRDLDVRDHSRNYYYWDENRPRSEYWINHNESFDGRPLYTGRYFRDVDDTARDVFESKIDRDKWDYDEQYREAIKQRHHTFEYDVRGRSWDYYYLNQPPPF